MKGLIRNKTKGKRLTYWEHALLKYGFEGMQFLDLINSVRDEDLDILEQFYIAYFDSTNPLKGYNIEKGGNANKEVSKATRVKMAEVHRIPSAFYHYCHGKIIATAQEIAKQFGYAQPNLNALRLGRLYCYRGWVCLDAPPRKAGRHVPGFWEHPMIGHFVGSVTQLVKMRGKGLHQSELSHVKKGMKSVHKGWAYLGLPKYEDEIKARIEWANTGGQEELSPGRKYFTVRVPDSTILVNRAA